MITLFITIYCIIAIISFIIVYSQSVRIIGFDFSDMLSCAILGGIFFWIYWPVYWIVMWDNKR